MKRILFFACMVLVCCSTYAADNAETKAALDNFIKKTGLSVISNDDVWQKRAMRLKPYFTDKDMENICLYSKICFMGNRITNFNDLLELYLIRDKYFLQLFADGFAGAENKIMEIETGLKDPDTKAGHEKIGEFVNEVLKPMGFDIVMAEGMINDVVAVPFLQDVLNKIAPEDYLLLQEYMKLYPDAVGGEYPFLGIEVYAKMNVIAEKMYQKYPKSKYLSKLENYKNYIFRAFVDFHAPVSEANGSYRAFDLNTDVYPYDEEGMSEEMFAKFKPESNIITMRKKIQKNVSETGSNGFVYTAVVGEVKGKEAAEDTVFSLIFNGLDIPHIIQAEDNVYFIAYRFYPSEERLKKEMKKIDVVKVRSVFKSAYGKVEIEKLPVKNGN